MIHSQTVQFDKQRFDFLFETIKKMAGGEPDLRLVISKDRDLLDTISHTVNTLAEELIYQKKQAEQARQSMSSFLQAISHDMRTPLTIILSCVELLNEPGISDPKRSELIHRVRNSTTSILNFITDLLDVARAEANQMSVKKSEIEIRKVVAESIDSIEPLAKTKHIDIFMKVDPKTPDTIHTCSKKFRQILLNLLSNALKFTSQGKIEIEIKTAEEEIHIDISDTGVGIHQDMHQNIFQPFTQEKIETSYQFGGSGLGLALSKCLAEVLGWQLQLVRSVPSEGSTFRIVIPIS